MKDRSPEQLFRAEQRKLGGARRGPHCPCFSRREEETGSSTGLQQDKAGREAVWNTGHWVLMDPLGQSGSTGSSLA